jgi:hypothetical protein
MVYGFLNSRLAFAPTGDLLKGSASPVKITCIPGRFKSRIKILQLARVLASVDPQTGKGPQ